MNNKSKVLVFFLSFIPGAGHMYLGLQRRGVQLMSAFFFITFLMGWLNLSLLAFILPVIWFYSLFDALHRAEGGPVPDESDELFHFSWFQNRPKLVGGGLIAIGCFVIFDRIIAQFITWEIRNYIQTGLVALVLIGVGVRILTGGRNDSE